MKLNEEEMYIAHPWLLTVPRVGFVEFSSLLFPKEYRTPFSFYLPHPQTFFNNSLLLSEEKRIFAEEKLHSAICEQAYIALVCIFYAAHRCPYLKFMAHVPLFLSESLF